MKEISLHGAKAVSHPGDALGVPSTAEAVIRDLATAAQLLPQLLDQIRQWLASEYRAGRLEGATGAVDACAYLEEAAGIASRLEPVLARAASAAGKLTVPYSDDEKDVMIEQLRAERPDVRLPHDSDQVFKTRVSVYGARQIEFYEAMCFMTGRRPHEMAGDILLDAIRAAQHDHETRELVEARRPRQTSSEESNDGP